MERIYLDYNASTPLKEEVIRAMEPFIYDHFGNPSASHWAANKASSSLEQARHQVAQSIGAQTEEVIFTSGGSEANNFALKGVFQSLRDRGNHIITSKVEHPAVMNPCDYLEKQGAQVTYLEVDEFGQVDPEDVENAVTDETILISIMHANNEVGTLQPISEITAIAKKNGIVMHTDASQSIGKVPIDVDQLQIDLLTVAGHKVYAPKGIGALYIRQGTPIEPLIHGAGHEMGMRAGTENVMLAVGLGEACSSSTSTSSFHQIEEIRQLRDKFWERLHRLLHGQLTLNGHPDERLANTLSVNFPGFTGEEVLRQIPEVAASTGSACHSGNVQLSSVLKAMGVEEHVGKGAVRFSLGHYTTEKDIDRVIDLLEERVLQRKYQDLKMND
ncbi:cysteine desulfurase family protein [Texcoconibacillus texcoconensis]|uniref:cysteine desulfurase n=1 Tax=Texcoconibacillus texcoconensis TaxID=1095777 RepID=A0A840QPM8_9BACI|nr:cysteine desulfurase family protein [Texcoconibacillus texcoconensis]MBB5173298.1 cysteine desulfurase [Texcoconibacillus texcoconensis]